MSAHSARIERYMATHPGATRSEARGHGKTPERPGRAEKQPDKYQEYLERRKGLEARLISLKYQQFGTSSKFRSDRSARNVRIDPMTGNPTSMSKLYKAIAFMESGHQEDYDPDEDYDDEYRSVLWYH